MNKNTSEPRPQMTPFEAACKHAEPGSVKRLVEAVALWRAESCDLANPIDQVLARVLDDAAIRVEGGSDGIQ